MDLPYEINFKIFTHLIPDETCDINAFREYFLVSKYFYNILNSYEFKIIFSKKIELYDTLLNINSPEYFKEKGLRFPRGMNYGLYNLWKDDLFKRYNI